MIDLPTPPLNGGLTNAARFLPKVDGDPSDFPIGQSYLGTPIYSNLIFLADSDTPENQNLIIDTVLMEVNLPKNVIRTPITGRQGTVKEYINRSDYEVSIQGLLVSEYANVFPKDQLIALKNLLELPKSISIASSFLQVFSIHNLVILYAKFNEQMGTRNEVGFTILAISDEPIEIRDI